VAIVFDKTTRAEEVLLNVVHLQQEGSIRLSDAVIAVKDDQGKAHVHQTVDVTAGKGAMTGGWWGLLLGVIVAGPVGGLVAGALSAGGGALYGKLVDVGLDDGWIRQMADWLEPGTSALLLLVAEIHLEPVLVELRRYEGRLVSTTFPDEVRARLEDALADHLRSTS
ncbi:MAG: DUF1269 domain-containing protein, partial [Acidimicrobiia bacterium]